MRRVLQTSAVKYAIIGVINTLVCWLVILALTGYIPPEIANVLGYGVGFANSYLLNKKFTFKSTNSHKRDLVRFSIAMGAAYLINLGVLVLCYRVLAIDKYTAQIIAAVFYTISGYMISKLWAFKSKNGS